MTFDTSLGISWLVNPLPWTPFRGHPSMVEVKGRLATGSFTFVFLSYFADEKRIRNHITDWLKGDEIVRPDNLYQSGYTLCGEMELMNPEEVFAPGNSLENWRLTQIRARCPQNVNMIATRSIVVVHGGEMLRNENFDIRWATRGPKALPTEVAQPAPTPMAMLIG